MSGNSSWFPRADVLGNYHKPGGLKQQYSLTVQEVSVLKQRVNRAVLSLMPQKSSLFASFSFWRPLTLWLCY